MIIPSLKVVDLYLQGKVALHKVCNARPASEAGRIACIVLHHDGATAAGERGTINWLNGASYDASMRQHGDARGAVSCHKYIRRDGTIVKIVPERLRAWHAGYSARGGREDVNDFSLGYEIANSGQGEPYTDEQYEAVAQCIAYDTALYHIPDEWVTTHKAIRDEYLREHPEDIGVVGRKYDPYKLDMERVWRRVREIRAEWPYDIPPWSQ